MDARPAPRPLLARCISSVVAARTIDDDDREFVALFLDVDIEMAKALAGTGEVDAALARLDGLLARFHACDHPMVMGTLHEARARIAWKAGRIDEYARSLAAVDGWFRPTGTAALVANVERLAELQNVRGVQRLPAPDAAAAAQSTPKQTDVTRVARRGVLGAGSR
jgi:hypothetical protein